MANKKKTTKKKTDKSDDVKIHKYQRDMTCALTREEIEECAQSMSRQLSERDIWEAQIKEQSKRDKSKLKDMETEVRRLSNSIRDKSELRLVDCERQLNWTTGRVTDVRLDTGAIVAERDMTEQERQRDLPLGDIEDEFFEEPEGDNSDEDSDDEDAAE